MVRLVSSSIYYLFLKSGPASLFWRGFSQHYGTLQLRYLLIFSPKYTLYLVAVLGEKKILNLRAIFRVGSSTQFTVYTHTLLMCMYQHLPKYTMYKATLGSQKGRKVCMFMYPHSNLSLIFKTVLWWQRKWPQRSIETYRTSLNERNIFLSDLLYVDNIFYNEVR